MRVLIVCSTSFYEYVEDIKNKLESFGYEVDLPNCYDNPVTNEDNKKMSESEYLKFFKDMYKESEEKVGLCDAILVLNYTKVKNGVTYDNYIGAATFLEMYEAFMQNKKIYVYNNLPDSMLLDEIKGFNPIILNGNLDLIKE